ncbi:MAG: TIGR00159 family protein, partial [Candidatus Dadabacteria bacterium]
MIEDYNTALNLVRQTIDILLVAYLIYRGILIIKGTRAAPMLWGLSIIVLLYFLSKPLGFVVLGWILGNFLSQIILVVVIIFQDEIRRGLTKIGLQPFFKRDKKSFHDKFVDDLTLLTGALSEENTGALIVIQKDVGLEDFVEDAVTIDAEFNRKLLYSIFQKNSPLHDGAVLIEGNRIKAASCVLPLSFNPDLDPNLGTRHRAALGITEVSDAIAVVVSEETGNVSIARDGKLIRNLDPAGFRKIIYQALLDKSVPKKSDDLDEEEEEEKDEGVEEELRKEKTT